MHGLKLLKKAFIKVTVTAPNSIMALTNVSEEHAVFTFRAE
jgi:hypothetical protein